MKCHATELSRNITDLSNYVSKLDSLEEFVTKKLESIESESMKSSNILERVSNLEELCQTLNSKLNDRISNPPPINSSQDNTTSHTLANIEELCKSLNHKLGSHVNIINPTSLPTTSNHTSSHSLNNQSTQNTNASQNVNYEPRDCYR